MTVQDAYHLILDPALQAQIPREAEVIRTPAILPGRFFRRLLRYGGSAPDRSNGRGTAPPGWLKSWFYTLFFLPDEFVGWLPFAVWRAKRLIRERKMDIIYSSAPPNSTHLIAMLLKKLTGVPWVADFRDLWDQYPHSYNPFGLRWKKALDRFLERRVVQTADHVIVISETMKQPLLATTPELNPEKCTVITNGFDPEDFNCAGGAPERKGENVCQIIHSGTLFPWRKTDALLAALRNLDARMPGVAAKVRLQFMGIVHDGLHREIAKYGLENRVEILPHESYAGMVSRLRAADYALLIVGDLPHNANALALKLFDYIGAGKPILALAPEGEARRLILKHRIGFVAPDHDPEEITAMLQRALAAWEKNRDQFSHNLRKMQNEFDRKNLTRKLTKILESHAR